MTVNTDEVCSEVFLGLADLMRNSAQQTEVQFLLRNITYIRNELISMCMPF